eukprot:71743-Rhodomonas_salina.1
MINLKLVRPAASAGTGTARDVAVHERRVSPFKFLHEELARSITAFAAVVQSSERGPRKEEERHGKR